MNAESRRKPRLPAGYDGLPPQERDCWVLREPSLDVLVCPGVMRALSVRSVVLPGGIR